MSKKKVFVAVTMIGLMLLAGGCGKKKNNNNNPGTTQPTSAVPSGPVANTKDNVIKSVEIEGLAISNVTFMSQNGTEVYSATVTNNNASAVYVQSFNLIFKNANGEVLIETLGFVGDTLQPNESRTFTTNLFIDIDSVDSIEYTRNY